MASLFIHHSLLLLFLAISIQTNAIRESQFFSKTSRYVYATSPRVSSSLPEEPGRTSTLPPLSPQTHINGYGLYAHNPDQFPTASATTTNYNSNNNVARYEPNTIPSTFTNAEFENKEFNANNNNNIPSNTFTYDTEFWDENYRNKEFDANHIPSSSANNENYENKEMNANNNNIPSGFSNGQLNRRNYPTYEKQYGMSDTRVMENGKYFYNANAKQGGYGRNYEPVKGNDGEEYRRDGLNGGYSYGGGNGSGYEYKHDNEVENQEEYVP